MLFWRMNSTGIIFLVLFVFCLGNDLAYAQSETADTLPLIFSVDSNIIQDKKVNELLTRHILINEGRKSKISGYRVQIHFGAEKAQAMEVKAKFMQKYSEVPSYLDYHQPYFKVRVGDFRTKLEAYKFMQAIMAEFPGAFIVKDEIELPRID